MRPLPRLASLSALLALLAGCLDEEETIVVRPDGSASVERALKADAADLRDGHPLPSGGPWLPADEATRAFLANPAAALDGAAGDEELHLAVRAELARLEDLPPFGAPADEPYRTAYLERRTSLAIERRGGKSLYVFERRLPARRWATLDPVGLVRARLPNPLWEKLDADPKALAAEEWREVAQAWGEALVDGARAQARSALDIHYERGEASLGAGAIEGLLAAVEGRVREAAPPARVERLVERTLAAERADDDASRHALQVELDSLEHDVREGLRAGLLDGLERTGLPLPTRNEIAAALEWTLTAVDHTNDLGDEDYQLRVTLPGTVVDGNFAHLEGSTASWRVSGQELRDREIVLRAVSVVE